MITMRRYLLVLTVLTLVGLLRVWAEVEALKVGYDIQRHNLTKLALREYQREMGSRIALAKAPGILEERLLAYRINLAQPKLLEIARSRPTGAAQDQGAGKTGRDFFDQLFVGTAQAEDH